NRWSNDFTNNGQNELENYLSDNCTINNASAVLFRKSVIAANGIIEETMRFAGDWLVYIRIAAHHNIIYIAECLNFYRNHLNNVSKRAEINGDIYFERVCCLNETHKNIKNKCVKEKI